MPSLIDLASACGGAYVDKKWHDIAIDAITSDSRQVTPGALFVALHGVKQDGAAFINDAIAKGAVAVLSEDATLAQKYPDTAWVSAQNARLALAKMAALFFNAQPEHIAAITGTDGKTSTAEFFRQLMAAQNRKSASIGTLGVRGTAQDAKYSAFNTTPDPVLLHRTLAELAKEGVNDVAIEASSHGLDQYRLDGVRITAAAFTNLTRDHLDYHKTEEEYFNAKARLFNELLPSGSTAVLCADDAKYPVLKAICEKRRHNILSFGRTGKELKILQVVPTAQGQEATLELWGKTCNFSLPLYGAFQIQNILAALGLLAGCHGTVDKAIAAISLLQGVPGRLEKIATHANGAAVFVDYAHTPAALANILKTLRPHTEKRLFVVFGCGGDRDKGKRPQMGKYAAELADVVVVTDDNPRSENPDAIREEVTAASPGAYNIGDRKKAIQFAVQKLQLGDVLVIAGKGHEKTQIIGNETLPFDDAAIAREVAA